MPSLAAQSNGQSANVSQIHIMPVLSHFFAFSTHVRGYVNMHVRFPLFDGNSNDSFTLSNRCPE